MMFVFVALMWLVVPVVMFGALFFFVAGGSLLAMGLFRAARRIDRELREKYI